MRKASLLVLFLTIFIDLLGFGIVIPLLAFYAREYGATGRTIGLVVGVYSLMQFLFAPVWGRLSDRFGRKPVLLFSLAGNVLGYLIFASATSLAVLFLARFVSGLAAANIGTAQAYIADATTAKDRARGMGLIGAAFGLGFILGPPLGGFLSTYGSDHGYHANFLPGIAAGSLSALAFTLALIALGESKAPTIGTVSRRPPQFDPAMWRLVNGDRALSRVLLTLFLIILAFSGMETSVTLHARDRFSFTARDLGYFFGLMGVVVALVQGGMMGPLSRRLGERRLILIGAASLALGLALIPGIFDRRYLYPVAALIALGQALCYPSLTSLVTRFAPAREHGSILGISSSLTSLSRMVGPFIAGVMYDIFAVAGPFFTGAAVVVLAFLITFSIPGKDLVTREQDGSVPAARPADSEP